MYIETERLMIRSIEPTDVDSYIDMTLDGSLSDIFGCFGDGRNCHKWMGKWVKQAITLDQENNPNHAYLAYTIVRKRDNIPIGSVGCSYFEDLGKIGITYFIGANFRGNGYAAEAADAYVQYFFNHYSVSEIIANVRVENKASCRTVEKIGFLLNETKMYRDINDEKPELYHFYSRQKIVDQ